MKGDQPLDFSSWPELTKKRIFRGQVEPVRKFVRGETLDVASNYGRFSTLSPSCVSVDMTRNYLEIGKQMGNIQNPVVGTALMLPFGNAVFETVIAMGIVDHIPANRIEEFLAEIVRVARTHANLIIQVTSPWSVWALINHKYYGAYSHPCSPFKLRRILHKRGWRLGHVFSSGLVGHMDFAPMSVAGLVPWATHITLIFSR